MITFVGAGPGAEDLITVRGQRVRGKKKPSYRGTGNAPCISFRI